MTKMQTEYPQDPVLIEDQYPAVLKSTSEYEKVYNGKPTTKVAWVFAVNAGVDAIDPDVDVGEDVKIPEDGVFEVAAHTSLATSPKSNFAQLNMPSWVGDDWDGDSDSLIGKEALVDVDQFTRDDGKVQNVISKIRLPRKKGKGAKAVEAAEKPEETKRSTSVDITEEDFEDIPM